MLLFLICLQNVISTRFILDNMCLKKGHCIKERIATREFKKILKSSFEIVDVEFEYMIYIDGIKGPQSSICHVLQKKDIDLYTSEIVYYSSEIDYFQQYIKDSSVSIIRYHFKYKDKLRTHFCESLCNFNFPFEISKNIQLDCKKYVEFLIYKAIFFSIGIGRNIPLLVFNLKNIHRLELYTPKHFEKVYFAKPFIMMLSHDYPAILSNDNIIKKYLKIFRDYYVTSVYKGGQFSSELFQDKIINKIIKDKKEDEHMMKTICDMLSDIIIITSLLLNDERTTQTGLYINQNDPKYTISVEKCFILDIAELRDLPTSHKNINVLLHIFNKQIIRVHVYVFNFRKLIIPLKNLFYDDVTDIEVEILMSSGFLYHKTIKLI
ncbi:hypothetical protein NGRA_1940 [Nosema granulosis]|uniref:Uncharacterized protein n=1 Tax=Nosema granulosis TaxID=83296 RepID=A0A9P6KYM5_9MICR|nr:hypothetical protein NGRA_1940 [Nosema granulosis]